MSSQTESSTPKKRANPTTSQTSFTSVFSKEYVRSKFTLYIEIGESSLKTELHQKRLQNLRKELNYIKNTDWHYDPIE